MFTLNLNGGQVPVEAEADTPLLWVLRDSLGLTGTKYSCGMGQCGCCTVLMDGEPVRSCTMPVSSVGDKSITTIEGLSPDGTHALQIAWLEERVTQCGYCQPGQIMSAAGLLQKNPHPSEEQIDEAMSSTLCRCGSYQRVRAAIQRAADGG
jgi:aerobic-type carbon monoxide dehydrogenase small subunit (CoxS/CutS family)